ncbi:MAG: RNA polymerase sigma factor [Kofleriaceae bacterium]
MRDSPSLAASSAVATRAPAHGAGPELAGALRLHGPSLAQSARRLCGNAADADDLVHDVYERALRLAARRPTHANVRAYLHRILRNLFLDRRRSAARRPMVPLDVVEVAWEPPGEREEGWSRVSDDQLSDAIAALPGRLQQVFRLHAYERLPYREIASRLGISPVTVGTRLTRARRQLRARLTRAASR